MESGMPYLIVGCLVTWAALAWYTWRLERRLERARKVVVEWSQGGEE